MAPRIGLLGDVMLGRKVGEAIERSGPEPVWSDDLSELLRGCDAVIANLECCISARGQPTKRVEGKPFFFRAPPAAIGSLGQAGVSAVGLANNHALDYETEALLDTLDLLDEAGIVRAGAGRDLAEARRGQVVEAAGARIGLVAASDHPRSYSAAADRPGIAYAELSRGVPEWPAAEIERLAGRCDLIIALCHWGPNMVSEPAGWQREAAAELVGAGADLVAGHSAHVFHGVGWGRSGPLIYDLGDALDDYAIDPVLRNDLGIAAIWTPGEAGGELELIGLHLDYCHTGFAHGEDAEWIADRLERACPPLGTTVERLGEQRFRVREAARTSRRGSA